MKADTLMKKHKLNIVIPIALLVVVLFTMILGIVLGWRFTVQKMESMLNEQVETQTIIFQDEIGRQFAVLEGYGSSFDQWDLSHEQFLLQKLNQCTDNTEFGRVCFAYPDGTLYRNDGVVVDVRERFYFQQGMQGNRVVQFLENYKIDTQKRVGLAVPVRVDGQVEGVLLGLYEEEGFRELFERVFSNVCQLSYLCDSQGKFIIGTEISEQVLEENAPGNSEGGGFLAILEDSSFSSGSKEQVQQLMQQNQGGRTVYTYQGVKRHVTFLPVGVNDWYIVAMFYEADIYRQAIGTAGIFYVLIFCVMASVLLILVYLIIRENKLILEERKQKDEIRYLFEHDSLTDVLTEKAFLEQVSGRLKEAVPGRHCLIYLDIYKFKLINQSFGYDKGDELLCALAGDLKKLTEFCEGLCGRINGDSFVLYLPHKEEIIKEFYTKKYRSERIVPLELYLYFGVYVIKDLSIPVDQMVDYARLAQKNIKGNYNTCVHYYDERIKQKLLKEQEVITSMAKALKDGEFVLYIQPQYNYSDGSVCGAEALVRWKSPVRGIIPPVEFISIFESNGFIIHLDEYVWEQVCKLLRKWLDEGRDVIPISINVSRTDLLKGGIAEKLMRLLRRYGLTTQLLRIEITESAYMDNPQQMIQEITCLTACGFMVEMDDFGSGYSSLNMLKDMPIQVLKTDLRFLSSTGADPRQDRVLASVIHMAKDMGMMVIAEGVETKEQADHLLSLNCERMQGYYFSKPLPVEEYEALVYSD